MPFLAAGMLAAAMALAPVAAAGAPVTLETKAKIKRAPVALSCPLVFPSACLDPVAGAATPVRVRLRRFESIEELCFVLRFEDDLVDPPASVDDRGEGIGIIYEGTFGFGFHNFSGPPIGEREICLAAGSHDAEIEPFLDGRQLITVYVTQGSATLSSVGVRVTGVLR